MQPLEDFSAHMIQVLVQLMIFHFFSGSDMYICCVDVHVCIMLVLTACIINL